MGAPNTLLQVLALLDRRTEQTRRGRSETAARRLAQRELTQRGQLRVREIQSREAAQQAALGQRRAEVLGAGISDIGQTVSRTILASEEQKQAEAEQEQLLQLEQAEIERELEQEQFERDQAQFELQLQAKAQSAELVGNILEFDQPGLDILQRQVKAIKSDENLSPEEKQTAAAGKRQEIEQFRQNPDNWKEVKKTPDKMTIEEYVGANTFTDPNGNIFTRQPDGKITIEKPQKPSAGKEPDDPIQAKAELIRKTAIDLFKADPSETAVLSEKHFRQAKELVELSERLAADEPDEPTGAPVQVRPGQFKHQLPKQPRTIPGAGFPPPIMPTDDTLSKLPPEVQDFVEQSLAAIEVALAEQRFDDAREISEKVDAIIAANRV